MTLTPIDQCGAKEDAIFYLACGGVVFPNGTEMSPKWTKVILKGLRNVPENKEILK